MELVKKLEATLASLPSHWKSDIEAVSEVIAALQVVGAAEWKNAAAEILVGDTYEGCDRGMQEAIDKIALLRAPVAVSVDDAMVERAFNVLWPNGADKAWTVTGDPVADLKAALSAALASEVG